MKAIAASGSFRYLARAREGNQAFNGGMMTRNGFISLDTAIAASPENGFGCVDGLLTFDHNWHVRGSTSNGSGGIMTASFEHTRHRERSKRTPSERSIPQVWKQAIHCCKLQVASVWGTPFANSNG
eukprot:scaffold54051_cov17-Tisochrysis_lutea.AAC.1